MLVKQFTTKKSPTPGWEVRRFFGKFYQQKNNIMDNFIEMLRNDLRTEGFTTKEFWLYGVFAPVAVLIIIGLAGWLSEL